MKLTQILLLVVLIKYSGAADAPPNFEKCYKVYDHIMKECALEPYTIEFFGQLLGVSKPVCSERIGAVSETARKCKKVIDEVQSTDCQFYGDAYKTPLRMLNNFVQIFKFSCEEEVETRDFYDVSTGCLAIVYKGCIQPLNSETLDFCR
jgi:hypothetical protein